jgi:hypothetical protein
MELMGWIYIKYKESKINLNFLMFIINGINGWI